MNNILELELEKNKDKLKFIDILYGDFSKDEILKLKALYLLSLKLT